MLNIKNVLSSLITIANKLISRVVGIKLIVVAASALCITTVHAQTVQWIKYRNDQTTASVSPTCNYQGSDRNFAKDSVGNFFVAGGASESGQGAVIYKFNGITGALLWRKNYVGAGNRTDCATSIAVDSVGDVAVTGYTSTGYGTPTNFIAKYNGVTGTLLWNVVTGFTTTRYQFGYIPSALAIDSTGNIIVTNLGTTKYNGQTGGELWTTRTPTDDIATGYAIVIDLVGDAYITGQRITKLNGATGAEVWSALTPTDTTTIYGNAIRLAAGNELVVTGYTGYGSTDNSEIITVKYSRQTGAVIWKNRFAPPNSIGGIASDVFVDSLGNISVTGYMFERISATQVVAKLPVLKYASDGTLLWATLVPPLDAATGEGSGSGKAIVADSNGNVFVTGFLKTPDTPASSGGEQWATLKFNGSSGAEQWRKIYTVPNGRPEGTGVAILFDSANDLIVLGYTSDPNYSRSIRVLSYANASGTLKAETSSNLIDAPSEAQSLVVDNSGNLIVAGTFGGSAAISTQMTKYDGATGQELWSVAKPLSYRPLLVTAANGDIFYAGNPFFPSSPLPGMRVQKHSSTNGQLLWEGVSDLTTLGFSTVAVTDANGDLYITGTVRATLGSSTDSARTVKFSGATGAELWKVSYSGNVGDSRGVSIAILPDGHVITTTLAGETSQQGTSTTVRVEKQDKTNGAVIWSSTIGSVFNSGGEVIVDARGDVFVAARVSNALNSSSPVYLRVTKFSGLTGALIWKVDRGSNTSAAIFLSIDAIGNPLIGHSETVTKLDGQTGNLIWTTPFLGVSLNDIKLLSSGQVAAGGWSYGADTGKDMRLVLYDGVTGSPVWSYAHDGGALADDNFFALATKGTNIFLAGSSQRLTRKPSWFVQKLGNVPAPAPFPLTLITNGTGGGSTVASPPGSPCEPTCNGGLHASGAIVTITPTARADSVFASWSGACTGSGTCRVTMSKAQFVAATFNLRKVPLNVAFVGSGAGTVASEPAGLNCSANCAVGFDYNSLVTLTATASPGSTFVRWGGACYPPDSSNTCRVPIADVNTVTVNFSLGTAKLYINKPLYEQSIPLRGNVASMPSGINCSPDCFYTYPTGTVVTLTATPLEYTTFGGWGGYPGCAGLGPCTVTMNGDVGISPVFNVTVTTVLSGGTGTGTISIPSWLSSCGTSCELRLVPGSLPVTLSAAPSKGSVFVGWKGGGCSGTGFCLPGLGTSTIMAIFNSITTGTDLSADGKSDLIFRNSATGQINAWLMNGTAATAQTSFVGPGNWTVTHTADFNGDGKADVLYRNDDGAVSLWLMNGLAVAGSAGLLGPDANWRVSHVGDFNGDGKADILWRHTNGAVTLWLMDGTAVTSAIGLLGPDANWRVSHIGDFDGDGKTDILWRNNSNGAVNLWLMNGGTVTSAVGLLAANPDWQVSHLGDFNGDGKTDILWRNNSNGAVNLWLMNGGAVTSAVGLLAANPDWQVSHTADFNGDGKADLLWRHTNGAVGQWLMNGGSVLSAASLLGADPNWRVTHTGDYNGDGKADLVWRNASDGSINMWLMNGAAILSAAGILGATTWGVVPTLP
jgi:FG-GAP-like repeat/Divergent InlB B-repeat domain